VLGGERMLGQLTGEDNSAALRYKVSGRNILVVDAYLGYLDKTYE
jgi:hypothetical protein